MTREQRLNAIIAEAQRVYGPGEYYISLGSKDVVLGRIVPDKKLLRAESLDALEQHVRSAP